MATDPGTGEVAIALYRAVLAGQPFPASVPDTATNQALFAQITSDVESLPPGVVPDIPWDYAEETP